MIFRQLDSDSDGKLDRAEIVTLLRKLQEAQVSHLMVLGTVSRSVSWSVVRGSVVFGVVPTTAHHCPPLPT